MYNLTRTIVRQYARLFSFIYRQGLKDAWRLDDEYACREFLSKHKEDGKFGTLDTRDFDVEWKEWRYYVSKWACMGRLYPIARDYIDVIAGYSYMWVILPVCMDFYMRGIADWIAFPMQQGIEMACATTYAIWGDFGKRNFKVFKRDDFLSFAQEYAFSRKHRFADQQGYPKGISFDSWCQCMWQMTRTIDYSDERAKKGYSYVMVNKKVIKNGDNNGSA